DLGLAFLLDRGPDGMTVDEQTGLVSWAPDASNPAEASVILKVFDARGSFATQEYTIAVEGGNRAPVFAPNDAVVPVAEGGSLHVTVFAIDPDGDPLAYRVVGLPPGASFDTSTRTLNWMPDFHSAGVYDLAFLVTDGVNEVGQDMRIVVAPANR